jgi:hypothetical protein
MGEKQTHPTRTPEHLEKISSPESRQQGGYGSAHLVHGYHKNKPNMNCHICRKEIEVNSKYGAKPEEKQ